MNNIYSQPNQQPSPSIRLWPHRLYTLLLVCLLTVTLARALLANPGNLDPTFSDNGKVTTALAGKHRSDAAMTSNLNGKILVADDSNSGSSDNDIAQPHYGGPPPPPDCPAGGKLYVKRDSVGNNDGTSWEDAFTYLNNALRVTDACEIWVAKGIYYPDESVFSIDNDRTATFQLSDNVALYGGFAGTESNRNDRDWQANLTILSGDLEQNDTTDANGIVTDTSNITGTNALHVVTSSGVTTATLDGFTITAGGNDQLGYGGGLHNEDGRLTLTNVTFRSNLGHFGSGGGISNGALGNLTLTNVTLLDNRAGTGGGIANLGLLTMHNGTLDGNHSIDPDGTAGAIYNNGTLTVTHSTFVHNVGELGGGALSNFGMAALFHSTIVSNTTKQLGGGGIRNDGAVSLTNVTLSGNEATSNSEPWGGGGALLSIEENAVMTITNSTIVHNMAPNQPNIRDGIWVVQGRITLVNTIVAHNGSSNCTVESATTTAAGGTLTSLGHNIATDTTCNLDGVNDQASTDPKLSPLTNNGGPALTHAPLASSPAIDAGDNNAVTNIPTDQRGDGFPRIQGAKVDIGAVEAVPGTLQIRLETTPVDETTNFTFSSNVAGYETFMLRHGVTQTLEQLAAASYQVTLQLPTGWAPSAPSCTDPTSNSQVDAANNLVTAQVEPGETILCTFQLAQVALTIDTRVNDQPADKPTDNDAPVVRVGTEVKWSYLVRNSGAAALPTDKLQVTASQADATPVRDTTTDIGNDGLLSPGESWRYNATSTAQDLSQLDEAATVEGCAPAGATPQRRALANSGTVQAYGVTATDVAHYCNPVTVVGSRTEGNNVTVALPSGGTLTIDMPAGAVDTLTELTFTPTALDGNPIQDGFIFLLQAFTLVARQNGQLQENFTFTKPIVITIDYTKEYEMAVADEEGWTLFFFDTATGEWSRDGITVLKHDAEKNQLVVEVAHLTQFALFAEEAPTHQAMADQTMCWGVDLDVRIDLPEGNGRQLSLVTTPTATMDLVVVMGDAPAHLRIRADAECTPYTTFHAMIARSNALLTEGCADNTTCNTLRRVLFATNGGYTITTVTTTVTVFDIYLPLLHKSCDGLLACE